MIASLRGRVVADRRPASACSTSAASATGSPPRPRPGARPRPASEVTLLTHLHVREDALQLFGFAQTAERSLFELLLGVSGVGPKAALAIVSGYAPDQIRRAVQSATTRSSRASAASAGGPPSVS